MINDITDLKEARQEINAQREELAVMKERNRMARDLHDNLGQILSFSGVQVQAGLFIKKDQSKSITTIFGQIEYKRSYYKRKNGRCFVY